MKPHGPDGKPSGPFFSAMPCGPAAPACGGGRLPAARLPSLRRRPPECPPARRWASGRTGTAGRRRSQPPVPGQASTGAAGGRRANTAAKDAAVCPEGKDASAGGAVSSSTAVFTKKGRTRPTRGFRTILQQIRSRISAKDRDIPVQRCVPQKQQHRRQQDPNLSMVADPADPRHHRVQKIAAQMGLEPVQHRQFRRLHHTSTLLLPALAPCVREHHTTFSPQCATVLAFSSMICTNLRDFWHFSGKGR